MKMDKDNENIMSVEDYRKMGFLTAKEVSLLLRISKSMVYEWFRKEECPFNVVKVNDRYIIPTNSFFAWYDSLNEQQ